jgi:Zn ribbon nucleic-acid-binding protein
VIEIIENVTTGLQKYIAGATGPACNNSGQMEWNADVR